MLKSFQVLFCIKLEKLGISIGIKMRYSGFVPFVLNNINKTQYAEKNFRAKSYSKAFYNLS